MRNKSFATINIAGLGIAIAACTLIGLFVYNELNFDSHITGKGNIFRLNEYIHYDGATPQLSAATGTPLASFLKNNNQEIENYTRLFPATPFIYPTIIFEYNGKKIKANQVVCTDTSFANMFGAKIIEGDAKNFMHGKNNIVLTKKLAAKIFGNEIALSKTLIMHITDTSSMYVTVSNVIADLPATSHIQVEGLLSFPDQIGNGLEDNYGALFGPTYLKLQPGIDIKAFETKLTNTIHTKNRFIDMRLQPLTKVHTQSTDIIYDYFNYNKIDGKYLNIFIVTGLAIFLIACINFISLTTAIAGYRGKEIAIKKIIGAKRIQIIFQIIAETFLSVLSSILLSGLLTAIFLPYMNNILNRELDIRSLNQFNLFGIYVIILLITTVIAGAYPAWLISSSKVNQVLRTKILFGKTRNTLRNVLVTGQFAIAVIFIISLIVFLKQLSYIQNKDLGYSFDQVIKVPLDMQTASKLPVIQSKLSKVKGVTDFTSGFMELGGSGSLFGIDYIAPDGEIKHISVNFENGARNYTQFFGMKIIKGDGFKKDNIENAYIINETLAKQIGYPDPVGKEINLSSFPRGVIIGIVKDFNYSSLHAKIEPLIIGAIDYVPVWQSQLYIKISTARISSTLKEVETVLKNASGDPFISYEFLDEHFKELYASDKQAGIMIAIIAGLAILIACLGLFSLASFIMVRRAKEISIRKVLGASIKNIITKLSKEFIQLVIIAFFIAVPVAGYMMNKWLQGFAYRISTEWWMFALGGIAAILIALLTVSFQAIRTAIANPLKSLRTE